MNSQNTNQPVAWMRDNRNECITAESKRQMEKTDFGFWKEIAASYTIPLYLAASHPQAAVARPDVCPITRQAFFMNIDHPDLGLIPTYGGPFDSFSYPYIDDDGALRVEHYDHDRGEWTEGGKPLGYYLTSEQPEDCRLPYWLERQQQSASHPHHLTLIGEGDIPQAAEPNTYHDAYRGARDDMQEWQKRALEAEESCRRLTAVLNDENGPTHMGEPVISAAQPQGPEPIITDVMVRAFHDAVPMVSDADEIRAGLRAALGVSPAVSFAGRQPTRYRCTPKNGGQPFTIDRAPDSWELRECDIEVAAQPQEAEQARELPKLTDREIEAGWHDTFSTNNPFCPCDLQSFKKAVKWAERARARAAQAAPTVPTRAAIEDAIWKAFGYGKHDYKGCVRETIRDLFAAAPSAPAGEKK